MASRSQQESHVLSTITTQNQMLPTTVESGKESSLRINLSSVQHLNFSLARHREDHLVCLFVYLSCLYFYLSYLIIIAYLKLHDSCLSSILRHLQLYPNISSNMGSIVYLHSYFGNLIRHILDLLKLASITFF